MKANNLRIGNYINTHNRVSVVLDLINTVGKFHISDPKRNEVQNKIKTTICYMSPQPEDSIFFTPIPITNEWMINFGFNEDNEDFVYEEGRQGFIVAKAQDDDLILLYREDIGVPYNILRFINYVHEIQNIVFSLTEKDLKFKKK